MRLFYSQTGVESIDCIINDEGIAFLVPKGFMGKAIGKKGVNIQKLRSKINKNIYLFENLPSEEEFIKKSLNISSPVLQENDRNNKKVIYVKLNTSDKYSMKRGASVSFAKDLFKRMFGKEMKIQSR